MEYVAQGVPLWSVTIWDKKFTGIDRSWQVSTKKYKYLLSAELDAMNTGGDVFLLYTGKDEGFTTEELAGDAISEGEVVSIPWGGTPSVKYHKGKFVTGDNRIATSNRPQELLNRYLYYYMKGRLQEIASYYRGAGLKHPSMKSILGMKISYPTVVRQEAIIAQFDSIESALEVCKKQIEKYDELVKSRFIEMFGNPDENSKSFETKSGSALFKIGNGKARSQGKRFEEGVPAYGGNGISWHTNEALVDHPTIVIGRVGRHCGNTRLVEEPCWVTDNAMFIKNFKVDCFELVYLSVLMEVINFNRFADAGDLWKITQKPFMEYRYPVPPLELQQEFAFFVQQVDKLKFIAQQQIEKLQELYDSLAQEYFGV